MIYDMVEFSQFLSHLICQMSFHTEFKTKKSVGNGDRYLLWGLSFWDLRVYVEYFQPIFVNQLSPDQGQTNSSNFSLFVGFRKTGSSSTEGEQNVVDSVNILLIILDGI